jgi:hypothetical protein
VQHPALVPYPSDTVVPAPTTPRALTTRALDFWLLGGASLVVWMAMFTAERFRDSAVVDRQLQNVALAALSLALIVNYPHFLASYKLAYSRGRSFIFENWWQLVVVPIALAGLFVAAYVFYDVPGERLPPVAWASESLRDWGANAQVVARPRLGELLLTAAFHLMVVTIGWHYTKQVFGCTVVYANFDGYTLTPAQRVLLRRALFTVWAMSLVDFNIAGDWRNFGGFSYSSFDLPDVLHPISQIVVAGAVWLVCRRILYANYRATGQLPSVNMVVPAIALCVWWLPLTRQEEFFYLLAPLFHSLQYLAFVYKMEDARLRERRHRAIGAAVLVGGVVTAGWLAFDAVPAAADARLGTLAAWQTPFFLAAAYLFINIHHYFIDNVIWRFKDPKVRAYLLG